MVAQRQIQDKVQVPLKAKLPSAFLGYIDSKIQPNESGGRPHFLSVIVKQGRDPNEILLDILEDAWLKGKPLGAIAKHYHTSHDSIWRLLKDLKEFKPAISELLLKIPRAKKWFIEEFETSDYETVQNYIKRAKREGLKNWAGMRSAWRRGGQKDRVTVKLDFFSSRGSQSPRLLDSNILSTYRKCGNKEDRKIGSEQDEVFFLLVVPNLAISLFPTCKFLTLCRNLSLHSALPMSNVCKPRANR